MRHETRHAHDNLVKDGDEGGGHFQPSHPRPKPRDSIRDCEIWCEHVPLIVVPLSQSRNRASVVRKVLDLHHVLSRFTASRRSKSCRRLAIGAHAERDEHWHAHTSPANADEAFQNVVERLRVTRAGFVGPV